MKIELLDLKEKIIQKCMETKTGKERLVILSAGNDPASEVYMRNKVKLGEQLGIETIHIVCDNQDELQDRIYDCNASDYVTGIIVQLPLPHGYDEHWFINSIDPSKDVDMLTDVNKAKMFLDQTTLLPATSASCLQVLNSRFSTLQGLDVLLIGRSDLCNIPLQKALSKLNCTVTLAHSKTKDLDAKCRNSDIIISAAGKHGLIDAKCISDKIKLILDVSINRVDGKIKGDVTDEVYDVVDVTANPRGLGILTTSMLFYNLINISKGGIK